MLSLRAPYVPAFAPRRAVSLAFAESGALSTRAQVEVFVGAGTSSSSSSSGMTKAHAYDARDYGAYVLAPALGGAFLGILFGTVLTAAFLAAVAGTGGYLVLRTRDASSTTGPPGNPSGVKLHGKIVAGQKNTHQPGISPLRAHVQSNPLFEWDYILGPHDTAGNIAAAIVGDPARYQELVLANASQHPTIGVPGKVGADEWNLAEESMVEGTRLILPQTWDPHIDPLGEPKGTRDPWPEDPRLLMGPEPGVKVEGYDVTNYSPDGEFVHYGATA